MADAVPEPVRLEHYRPPDFFVDTVTLTITLDPARTRVRARLALRRNPRADPAAPLHLDADGLTLESLALDGAARDPARLTRTDRGFTLPGLGHTATLETVCTIDPAANTELSGLYRSADCFVTQCEAEGFRRITPFPDRPDVLARYHVTLIADPASCPALLANGNLIARGTLPDGRHWASFVDPHPKPCYLFALVAGRFQTLPGRFTTRSGREIALAIHLAGENPARASHAMDVLQRAMEWDERVFGREYDLDSFHIVAVPDFNMGAMENKGLNIFNTKYVLADPETATDADYTAIETVIAHEYFHNWTGNRVTCRDWFQLSLKEGLTVFRDQEFSADQGSRAVRRIADVRRLRATQFPEDAGPLAHPVQPKSYRKIDNFYTATIYQKGAELVRMIHTLVGPAGFRAGMDLYFARHDNQAVTIEDFLAAMQDGSGQDLSGLRLWYDQAGTPSLAADWQYDAEARTLTLSLRQSLPGRPDAAARLIPLAFGLIGASGAALAFRLEGEAAPSDQTRILRFDTSAAQVTLHDVAAAPVPSLLRGFSAPVTLAPLDAGSLAHLARHDPDPFVAYESGQQTLTHLLLTLVASFAAGHPPALDPTALDPFRAALADPARDPGWLAEFLTLPAETTLADAMAVIDIPGIHAAHLHLREALGRTLAPHLAARHTALAHATEGAPAGTRIAERALKLLCLSYRVAAGEAALARHAYDHAPTMTDRIAALRLLAEQGGDAARDAFAHFHSRAGSDALLLDKWFLLQAMAPSPDDPSPVAALAQHPDFTWRNPNRVHALLGGFSLANPVTFHAASGAGYRFFADALQQVDRLNPQTAARLVAPLGSWRRHEPGRAAAMRAALQSLADCPDLSAAMAEMVGKCLA